MVRRCAVLFILTAAAVIGTADCSLAVTYKVRKLDAVKDHSAAWATDINDKNQIVGWSRTPKQGTYTVTWDLAGRVKLVASSLGATVGIPGISSTGFIAGQYRSKGFVQRPGGKARLTPLSVAYGVNSTGTVVGMCDSKAALVEPGGRFVDLGGIPGCDATYARGVNDAGWVVGYGNNPGEFFGAKPFIWKPSGQLTLLSDFGKGGRAADINNGGQVVGTLWEEINSTPIQWAVVWEPNGSVRKLPKPDTAQLASAWGISSNGWVAGSLICFDHARVSPAIWTADGTRIDLETLPGCKAGWAMAVNGNGIAVGYCVTDDQSAMYAVVWEPVP